MSTNTQLVLIDGNNFLYRAYYSTARSALSNSRGEPTGATKVYISMIQKLEKTYPKAQMAVVFDAHGPCFRHELYSEYKATRKPMPDELRAQVENIKKIITAMGLPLITVEGVEADDVLGTYARLGSEAGMDVYLATGDKDLAAMVNEHVFIVNTMDDSVMDREGVIAKFGVPPELISDFLALKGDSADNIPGMQGIGDKSATALLNSIGSIEDIAANLDRVKDLNFRGSKTFAENFIKQQDNVKLSKILTTIKTDVKVPVKPQEIRRGKVDHKTLLDIYTSCEFTKLINSEKAFLEKEALGDSGDLFSANGENTFNNSAENEESSDQKTSRTVDRKKKFIAVTVNSETTLKMLAAELRASEKPVFYPLRTVINAVNSRLTGLGIRTVNCDFYIPLGHSYLGVPVQLNPTDVFSVLAEIVNNGGKEITAYDIKDLMHTLDGYGINIEMPYQDVLNELHDLDSAMETELPKAAEILLDQKLSDEQELCTVTIQGSKRKQKIPMEEVEIDTCAAFTSQHLDAVQQLHEFISTKLRLIPENERAYLTQELPLIKVLYKMECNGFYLDHNEFSKQSITLNQKLKDVRDSIIMLAGEEFNINSTREVSHILYEKLGIDCPKKTPTGQPSTSEETLSLIAEDYEIARLILNYRALTKLINTYVDKLPGMVDGATGRIHGMFNQAGTSTGRLSSSDPNLQNIPVRTPEGRAIRAGFAAKPGYKILAADYSQIELRLMAHIADEQNMIRSFNAHEDIHASTASQIHNTPLSEVTPEMRRSAKAINFGLIYGMNRFGLAKRLNISNDVAKNYIDSYFAKYPGVKTYMAAIKESVHENGYVTTISGRRLNFNAIKTATKMAVSGIERAAINAPMQGSAAEIIKTAMIKIDEWIKNLPENSIRMLLQVHDELIFEIKDEFVEEYGRIISEIMTTVIKLKIPLEVSVGVGQNWSEAH